MLDDLRNPPVPPESDMSSPVTNPAPRKRGSGITQLVLPSVLVLVAFGAGWFGNAYVNRDNYVSAVTNGHVNQEYVLDQAWQDITHNFYDASKLNQQHMADAAITAMVGTLNDTGHSRFETAAQYKAEQQQLTNAPEVGIGVYLSGGGSTPLTIDAIIPGSPAEKATPQIKPGDQIVAVGGKSVTGMTFDQVHPLISGTKGTKVTLTIHRPSDNTTFDVTMTRENFTAPIVTSYIIPTANVAYIQITQFAAGTDNQLRTALKQAQSQHVAGIVLDLRGNPGGYLDQAISVASEFIPVSNNNAVLIEKTSSGRTVDKVQSGGQATKTPLAILVDGDTASAAEITAGAITIDRHDVPLIGQTTFGTGTVLQTFQLTDGSVLVLGTEEFLLPNGQSIYHHGLTPSQSVALPKDAVPLSPLVAKEDSMTYNQILQGQDTQLQRALQDLTGQQPSASATPGATATGSSTATASPAAHG